MTPPIFTPDGTEVEEVILPDGSKASEVIAPDGTVVFEDAIPDSVVSRPDDTNDTTRDDKTGMVIETKTSWPSIGVEISNDTNNVTTAYLYEADSESDNPQVSLIDDVDVSSLSGGDAFAFDDVGLNTGEEFSILLDAGGSDYDAGVAGASDYPFTTDDLDIIARSAEGTMDQDTAFSVNNIGNPNGILD